MCLGRHVLKKCSHDYFWCEKTMRATDLYHNCSGDRTTTPSSSNKWYRVTTAEQQWQGLVRTENWKRMTTNDFKSLKKIANDNGKRTGCQRKPKEVKGRKPKEAKQWSQRRKRGCEWRQMIAKMTTNAWEKWTIATDDQEGRIITNDHHWRGTVVNDKGCLWMIMHNHIRLWRNEHENQSFDAKHWIWLL